MAQLRVPERYKAALVRLASQSEPVHAGLLAALQKIGAFTPLERISENIASSEIDGLSRAEARITMDALLSLYVAKAGYGKSARQVAEDVADAIKGPGPDDESISESQASVFCSRLEQLLSIDALDASSKATALQAEYQNLFDMARVLTDMRPVFPSDPGSPPVGAVIVHNLKIQFIASGERKEMFFALDHTDIDKLIETLTRAKAKAQTLNKIASSSALGIIELK